VFVFLVNIYGVIVVMNGRDRRAKNVKNMEKKTKRIMMATVYHVISGQSLRTF
jgi:hypothetical protein